MVRNIYIITWFVLTSLCYGAGWTWDKDTLIAQGYPKRKEFNELVNSYNERIYAVYGTNSKNYLIQNNTNWPSWTIVRRIMSCPEYFDSSLSSGGNSFLISTSAASDHFELWMKNNNNQKPVETRKNIWPRLGFPTVQINSITCYVTTVAMTLSNDYCLSQLGIQIKSTTSNNYTLKLGSGNAAFRTVSTFPYSTYFPSNSGARSYLRVYWNGTNVNNRLTMSDVNIRITGGTIQNINGAWVTDTNSELKTINGSYPEYTALDHVYYSATIRTNGYWTRIETNGQHDAMVGISYEVVTMATGQLCYVHYPLGYGVRLSTMSVQLLADLQSILNEYGPYTQNKFDIIGTNYTFNGCPRHNCWYTDDEYTYGSAGECDGSSGSTLTYLSAFDSRLPPDGSFYAPSSNLYGWFTTEQTEDVMCYIYISGVAVEKLLHSTEWSESYSTTRTYSTGCSYLLVGSSILGSGNKKWSRIPGYNSQYFKGMYRYSVHPSNDSKVVAYSFYNMGYGMPPYSNSYISPYNHSAWYSLPYYHEYAYTFTGSGCPVDHGGSGCGNDSVSFDAVPAFSDMPNSFTLYPTHGLDGFTGSYFRVSGDSLPYAYDGGHNNTRLFYFFNLEPVLDSYHYWYEHLGNSVLTGVYSDESIGSGSSQYAHRYFRQFYQNQGKWLTIKWNFDYRK